MDIAFRKSAIIIKKNVRFRIPCICYFSSLFPVDFSENNVTHIYSLYLGQKKIYVCLLSRVKKI